MAYSRFLASGENEKSDVLWTVVPLPGPIVRSAPILGFGERLLGTGCELAAVLVDADTSACGGDQEISPDRCRPPIGSMGACDFGKYREEN